MKKEEKIYTKYLERPCSLFDTKAWYEGESKELEKWFGVGFYNTIFVSNDNIVTIYYDKDECDKFDEAMDKKLTENLFNELCDFFFELIKEAGNIESDEDIFKITVKCWPAFTIFDEISKYPEWATDSMLRRLIRIRTTTETFSYELAGKVKKQDQLKEYIFFKGNVIIKPLQEFIKENDIIIENE